MSDARDDEKSGVEVVRVMEATLDVRPMEREFDATNCNRASGVAWRVLPASQFQSAKQEALTNGTCAMFQKVVV
jgi:hypothetical protein